MYHEGEGQFGEGRAEREVCDFAYGDEFGESQGLQPHGKLEQLHHQFQIGWIGKSRRSQCCLINMLLTDLQIPLAVPIKPKSIYSLLSPFQIILLLKQVPFNRNKFRNVITIFIDVQPQHHRQAA